MEFRIADTFTDSLAKLTGEEQKAVKTTAFDLQLNPAHPSLQLHKLDKSKDPNFWSIRVSQDIPFQPQKAHAASTPSSSRTTIQLAASSSQSQVM